MHQVPRRWFFASLVFVGMGLAAAGWVQAQPLPQASIAVDIAPGVHGRIDIGAPPPVLWQPAEPVYVQRPAPQVQQQPIYLAVPPKHAKKWHKHCHRYGACARPVVLVQQPDQGGRPDRDGYWQNGHGHAYKHHKHYQKSNQKDKHRYKHRHGDGD